MKISENINNKYILNQNINKTSYKPNFQGYQSVLGKTIEDVLELNGKKNKTGISTFGLMKKIQDYYLKRKDKLKNLGNGTHAKVLRIDDKYVLRMSNEMELFAELPKEDLQKLKTYYGHPVFSFGPVSILKNVSPSGKQVPFGVPAFMAESKNMNEINSYYDSKYLPLLHELPQKAFDDIASDFSTLNSLKSVDGDYLKFDTLNPNNFLIVGKKIRIVDAIVPVEEASPNTFVDFYNVCLGSANYHLEAPMSKSTASMRKDILKKIIIASEKAQLPYYKNIPFHYSICRRMFLIDSKMIEKLYEIRESCSSKKERIQKISEYVDSL